MTVDSEARQRFQIIKQAELSYAVLLDGEHIDEFTDKPSAIEYMLWFSAKLDTAYAAGMRAARGIKRAAELLGSVKSERKAVSSAQNGKLGGRPLKPR